MASIEMIEKEGQRTFVGVVEFDNCSEVIDNFDGEIQGNRYILDNSNEVLGQLFSADLISRSEKQTLENCTLLAFTGAKQ